VDDFDSAFDEGDQALPELEKQAQSALARSNDSCESLDDIESFQSEPDVALKPDKLVRKFKLTEDFRLVYESDCSTAKETAIDQSIADFS